MTEQSKPLIFLVDNDADLLANLAKGLEEHAQGRYQVAYAASAGRAMEDLIRYKLRDTRVALLLVDCDLGDEDGTALIEKASPLFPQAKRVLLAEYDERDNAVRAMRRMALDDYLLKPLDEPADNLYRLVDELLEDWQIHQPTPENASPRDITVVGYRWSASTHEVKDFLARNLVPYRWLEIEQPEGQKMIENAHLDSRQLPVIFFPDDSWLARPSIEQLADKVGLRHKAGSRFYDLVVVGGGPAGLSAAVYGASEGLRTLLIEAKAPGGQAGASSRIDNYLGFPAGLSGSELTRRAVSQAERFGVEILTPQEAVGVRVRGSYRLVTLADGSEVACHGLLIATGVSYHRIHVPGEDRLAGAGVYYGAVMTEAISCVGREVYVLGGGNSAGQAAMYLSRYAEHIIILTLDPSLETSMSQYLIHQIEAAENISVRTSVTVTQLHGSDHLEQITIRDETTGKEETAPTVALFVYIGAHPRTNWLGDLLVRDPEGYILTGNDVVNAGQDQRYRSLGRSPYFLESSVPGIFAAGDTRCGSVKRIASSVGEGGMAITLLHQYLASL